MLPARPHHNDAAVKPSTRPGTGSSGRTGRQAAGQQQRHRIGQQVGLVTQITVS